MEIEPFRKFLLEKLEEISEYEDNYILLEAITWNKTVISEEFLLSKEGQVILDYLEDHDCWDLIPGRKDISINFLIKYKEKFEYRGLFSNFVRQMGDEAFDFILKHFDIQNEDVKEAALHFCNAFPPEFMEENMDEIGVNNCAVLMNPNIEVETWKPYIGEWGKYKIKYFCSKKHLPKYTLLKFLKGKLLFKNRRSLFLLNKGVTDIFLEENLDDIFRVYDQHEKIRAVRRICENKNISLRYIESNLMDYICKIYGKFEKRDVWLTLFHRKDCEIWFVEKYRGTLSKLVKEIPSERWLKNFSYFDIINIFPDNKENILIHLTTKDFPILIAEECVERILGHDFEDDNMYYYKWNDIIMNHTIPFELIAKWENKIYNEKTGFLFIRPDITMNYLLDLPDGIEMDILRGLFENRLGLENYSNMKPSKK